MREKTAREKIKCLASAALAFFICYFFKKMLDNIPYKGYNDNAGGKTNDRKAVNMMDNKLKEVVGMTDKQFQTALEQILLYAKKAEDKQEIIEYLKTLIEENKKA